MSSITTQTAGSLESARARYEVADIFRAYGQQYRQKVPLPLSHLKVMHAIETCRTAHLGGHVERCDWCGFERIAYNSCRNRHCPKCQALAKAEWLEKRKAELLPVEYFHNVFTIPQRGSLTEGLFMSSRDGRSFARWQEALLRPGLNRSKWQNRSNYIWLGMVETQSKLPGGGKELSIYSNEGYYKGQGASTRRYTYRIDGFVSLHGSFQGGEMITKPLVFEGNSLMVNFSTSAAGSLRLEIQDSSGKAVNGYTLSECREIYGDEIERVVQWNEGDVGNLAGEPIRLRFVLKDADVFAFGFRAKPH